MNISKESEQYKYIDEIVIFGQSISFLRKKNNLTIKAYAQTISYDRSRLSRVEDGIQNIKLNTAIKIAQKTNHSLAMLFSRSFVDDPQCQQQPYKEADHLLVFRNNIIRIANEQNIPYYELYPEHSEVVSRILTGAVTNPHISTMGRMAQAIDIPLYKLLEVNT